MAEVDTSMIEQVSRGFRFRYEPRSDGPRSLCRSCAPRPKRGGDMEIKRSGSQPSAKGPAEF
jgi:hypothetical protein